jgi:hypothetical protein
VFGSVILNGILNHKMSGLEEIIRIFHLYFAFFLINEIPITSGICRMNKSRNQNPITGLLQESEHIFVNLCLIFLDIPLCLSEPLPHKLPILSVVLREVEIVKMWTVSSALLTHDETHAEQMIAVRTRL